MIFKVRTTYQPCFYYGNYGNRVAQSLIGVASNLGINIVFENFEWGEEFTILENFADLKMLPINFYHSQTGDSRYLRKTIFCSYYI